MNFARPPSKLKTLLILGRVSNAPTVWSNCLAGWWLGGGGHWLQLLSVAISMTFLYIGGMFLNDAFDANFDRAHRRSRPIPSGAISEKEVWQWGGAWMVLGAAGLLGCGQTTAILTLLLTGCILLYNTIHKMAGAAPVLMGACRLLVYLVAASVAKWGVSGYVLWCGLALDCYVMGLSWIARKESWQGPPPQWAALLLAAPLALAYLVDDAEARGTGLLLSGLLAVWIFWALRQSFWRPEPKIGFTVSRLLAGIALVDLLAMADLTQPWSGIFVVCFVSALLLQRYVPAT